MSDDVGNGLIERYNHARLRVIGPPYCETEFGQRNPNRFFVHPSYKPFCPACAGIIDADLLFQGSGDDNE